MKRILAFCLILVVLIPVLFKGMLWIAGYMELKTLRDNVDKYALIRWQGIRSSLDGRLGVEGLAITPFAIKETIVIDRIDADFKSLKGLVSQILPVLSGRFPASMSFHVQGARLLLNDASLTALLPDNKRLTDISLSRIYACGDIRLLTGRELRTMGYEAIEYEGTLAYQLSETEGSLALTLNFEAAGMGKIQADMMFDYGGAFSPASLFSDSAMLRKATISLKDLGFYRRLAFLCGRLNNLSQSEYIRAALSEWSENLRQAGIQIPEDFVSALNEYMGLGAELRIQLEPRVSLAALIKGAQDENGNLIRPDSIIAGLNPSYGLSWAALKPLEIQFDKERFRKAMMTEQEIQQLAQKIREAQNRKREVRTVYRFVPFDVQALPAMVGREVRLKMMDGREHVGRLEALGDGQFQLVELMKTGEFGFPVIPGQVAQFFVKKRFTEVIDASGTSTAEPR